MRMMVGCASWSMPETIMSRMKPITESTHAIADCVADWKSLAMTFCFYCDKLDIFVRGVLDRGVASSPLLGMCEEAS